MKAVTTARENQTTTSIVIGRGARSAVATPTATATSSSAVATLEASRAAWVPGPATS